MEVKNIANKKIDETKPVAPKFIFTGENVLTDIYHQNIVLNRQSEETCIIGKERKKRSFV